LRRPAYRALTQRLGASFHLSPLSLAEAEAYVAHRLRVAGARNRLFTPQAVAVLHRLSGGVPRLLNHFATQALIEAMGRGDRMVDAEAALATGDGDLFEEGAAEGPQPVAAHQ